MVHELFQRVKTEALGSYIILWEVFTSYFPVGKNIYSGDWDLAIILDSCRIDVLNKVSGEYDFLPEISKEISVGSHSKEWLQRTFTTDYFDQISQTTLLSANPYVKHLRHNHADSLNYITAEKSALYKYGILNNIPKNNTVPLTNFENVFSLSDDYDSEDEFGFLHPRTVTDIAISYRRDNSPEKMVVHYMQPHEPYFSREGEVVLESPFEYLIETGNRERVMNAYIENLRFVLDQTKLLLKNTDASSVLLTSDHGELFGEWGIYSHEAGILHPSVRMVPWVKTTATDTCSYSPTIGADEAKGDWSTENDEQLKALGYK